MEKKFAISEEAENKLGQLKAILYLLQTNLEELQSEVDSSYELLKIGERTSFSRRIEEMLSDPLGNVTNVYENIDNKIKHLIDLLVKSYLQLNKGIIKAAYRSQTSHDTLHYSIVLKEDNAENRNRIFDFYDRYELLDIAARYPVLFQFVPSRYSDKIRFTEQLHLA